MIKYVWDTAVGDVLCVIVGKVPKLHCHQFFTISLLEGRIQSLILFPFFTIVTFTLKLM